MHLKKKMNKTVSVHLFYFRGKVTFRKLVSGWIPKVNILPRGSNKLHVVLLELGVSLLKRARQRPDLTHILVRLNIINVCILVHPVLQALNHTYTTHSCSGMYSKLHTVPTFAYFTSIQMKWRLAGRLKLTRAHPAARRRLWCQNLEEMSKGQVTFQQHI